MELTQTAWNADKKWRMYTIGQIEQRLPFQSIIIHYVLLLFFFGGYLYFKRLRYIFLTLTIAAFLYYIFKKIEGYYKNK